MAYVNFSITHYSPSSIINSHSLIIIIILVSGIQQMIQYMNRLQNEHHNKSS